MTKDKPVASDMEIAPEESRSLFAEERRQKIITLLTTDSHVRTADLTELFGVSPATLRSDLRILESRGLLKRTHGGAIPLNSPTVEVPLEHSAHTNSKKKIAICAEAAKLVSPGQSLFCDSGSTVVELINALEGVAGLTIITHDLSVASTAETKLPHCSIIMLGGMLRQGFHYTSSSLTVEQAELYAARSCFLGATAFSFEYELTADNYEGASIKRAFMRRSERSIMLLDSSKIDHFAPVSFANLEDIDVLITDDGISDIARTRIEAMPHGPKLIIADTSHQ
ncbi:DeoR/GlpR family DNA-binding transcription regulator [Collinsella sp. AGMB00827]|uniref:DeoR/GlpR family DNA-binding transcription regulator n=1 Tax=Collinsella ureilytica TaxID=2869515 RepID=A0ABS7MI66_9ACTN|nr:DeoR/GlpR family DNA-binding transcription regulator [Collinsella urealyticum]MBY4797066.1 DeoR/GlpR family DNA-binding transcription regulator [Collinsella urealyticum]